MKSVKYMIEEKFCTEAGYRAMILIPIFARGVAKFAGYIASPKDQCASGMIQVFKFVCDRELYCGEPDLVDAAAEISIQIASLVYDDDTVNAAFEDKKKWMINYCQEKPKIFKPKPKAFLPPEPKVFVPMRAKKW